MLDSIVSTNTGGGGAADNLGGLAPVGSGGNLVGSGAVGLDPADNLINVHDPMLGPLQDNGGSTLTMAPLPGSPAIDAGVFLLSMPATDQAGNPRVQGPTPDVGAIEITEATPAPEAQGLVVTTLSDSIDPYDDQTSLREALDYAVTLTGDQSITFAPGLSGTIDLAPYYGTLVIADAMGAVTIDGGGAITLDAMGNSRVVQVAAGTTATLDGLTITGGSITSEGGGGGVDNAGTLTMNDCSITGNITLGAPNGFGAPGVPSGGGVLSSGTLTLYGCSVTGNSASSYGGGVYNRYGTMTVDDCTVTGNSAGTGGGGIMNFGGLFTGIGTTTVEDCSVTGNSATSYGGGIGNIAGTLSVDDCIVTGNSATSNGGGIFVDGTTTVDDCAITGNSSGSSGGGLYVDYSTLTMTGDTVAADVAAVSGGGIAVRVNAQATIIDSTIVDCTAGLTGGGVFNQGGTLTLTGVTVADNQAGAAGDGGGIFAQDYVSKPSRRSKPITIPPATTLTDTIVLTNTAGSPACARQPRRRRPAGRQRRQPRRLGRRQPRRDDEPRRHRRPAARHPGQLRRDDRDHAALARQPGHRRGDLRHHHPGHRSARDGRGSAPWTSAPSRARASSSPRSPAARRNRRSSVRPSTIRWP